MRVDKDVLKPKGTFCKEVMLQVPQNINIQPVIYVTNIQMVLFHSPLSNMQLVSDVWGQGNIFFTNGNNIIVFHLLETPAPPSSILSPLSVDVRSSPSYLSHLCWRLAERLRYLMKNYRKGKKKRLKKVVPQFKQDTELNSFEKGFRVSLTLLYTYLWLQL